ncbi:alpha/beta-hydrolase [Auricularia subglabra TFB-10046 SS5]|nr:alpha/beta-hydrolase [Auricularia subglabra TFB-10046 SS5]
MFPGNILDSSAGVGFSHGPSDVKDEEDVAEEFYGFLHQFYAAFPELLDKKLYLTGESYAGMYVPYIANRIVTASEDEKKNLPIDVNGILMNDGVYSSFVLHKFVPMARFFAANQAKLGVSDSVVDSVFNASVSCGFEPIMDLLTYPPKAHLPPLYLDELSEDCWLGAAQEAAQAANPCLNINDISVKCPSPVDHIVDYFTREDLQEALHVSGSGAWSRCVTDVLRDPERRITDSSPFSEVLFPGLISAMPRGLTLWHGLDDMNALANGTRLTIQNLTWAGAQGFQTAPSIPIFHSERGLTYYEIENAGHYIPTNQPMLALEVFKTFLGKGQLLHTDGGR